MNSRARNGLVVLLVLALAAGAYLALRTPFDADSVQVPRSTGETAAPGASSLDADETIAPALVLENAELSPQPSNRQTADLDHRVVDVAGVAIAGATLSFGAPLRHEAEMIWPWTEPTHLQANTSLSISDIEGRFTGTTSWPARNERSFVWITHPGHAARSFVIESGQTLASLPAPIVLEYSEVIRVTVVDDAGRPISGAEVHQRLEHRIEERKALDDRESEARLALWRTVVTDTEGHAVLAHIPGRQLVDARTAKLRSKPWRGTSPESVTLVVDPLAMCSGRVIRDNPDLDLSRVSVRAFARIGGWRQPLAAVPIASDGTISPFSVPIVDAERYEFELIGGDCVPTSLRRVTPTPGAVVDFELHARKGTKFPVRVLDDQDGPLSAVVVSWAWRSGEHWEWWFAGTDTDGLVHPSCIPAGTVWIEARRSGYLTYKSELEHAGDFWPAFEVRLERGGVLLGQVTADGEPVQNFRLAAVPVGDAESTRLREHDARDSKDGRYEFDGVPLGEVAVFAYSTDHPRSATQIVSIRADTPAIADFILPKGANVSGKVVNSETFEAIVGAAVRPWIVSEVSSLRPWGAGTVSDAQGQFEVEGASTVGRNMIHVTAPGFADGYFGLPPAGRSTVELGTVTLAPPISLELVVERGEADFANPLIGRYQGMASSFREPLPASGRLLFEGLRPERGILSVDDGRWTLAIELSLTSNGPGVVPISLRRVRQLSVRVKPAPGNAIPVKSVLSATYWSRTTNRRAVWTDFVSESSPVDIGYLDGDRFVLDVQDSEGNFLGSRVVADPDRAGPVLEFQLGGADRSLRVVDRSGAPIPRATVWVSTSPRLISSSLNTDSSGIAELKAFADDVTDLRIFRLDLGMSWYRSFRLSKDTTEVLFDPDSTVRIRLRDGDRTMSGIEIGLMDGFGYDGPFFTANTNDEGEASSFLLDPGTYELRIDHPGLWPVRTPIQTAKGNEFTTVQVRRLGSAVLEVRRGGALATDGSIAITSDEFDDGPSAWLAAGRITSSSPELRTDSKGRLRLDGLPHGGYRWAIEASDGTPMSGRFDVLPSQRVDVNIVVP